MKNIIFNLKKIIFSMALAIFAFNLGLNAIPRSPNNSRRRSPENRSRHQTQKRESNRYQRLAYLTSLMETESSSLSDKKIKMEIRDLFKKDINNDLKLKIKKEVKTALNSNEFKTEINTLLRKPNCNILLESVPHFIEKAKRTFLDDKLLDELLNYGKLNLNEAIPTFITYLEGTNEFTEYEKTIDSIDQTIFDDIFLQKIIVDIFSKFTAIKELDLSNNYLIEIPTHIDKLTHLEKLDLSSNQILPTNLNTQAITNLRELKFFNIESYYEEEEDFDDEENFPATIGHLFKDEYRNIYTIEKEFVKKSMANEVKMLLEEKKYEIFIFFKINNTTDTNKFLSYKTDDFLKKIQDIFCNTKLLEELVQFKSLNLSKKIPQAIIEITNIYQAIFYQTIFEKLIFDQIIIGIYSKWIPIFNLDLSNNSLISIPQNFHMLRNLEKCDLSGNTIEKINTAQIKQFEYLEYLNLTSLFDQITTFGHSGDFPQQIGHLTKNDNENIYRFIN